MTGRYSIRYGVQYSVINSGAAWGIPLTEKVCEASHRSAALWGGGTERETK